MNFVPRFFPPEEEFYDVDALRRELPKLGVAFCVYESLDSTSSEARRRASDVPLPALFLAEEQTGGRGRLGRSFYSPREQGVYLTLLLDGQSMDATVGLTAAVGVAAVRAVREVIGTEAKIKWVNDLYVDGKKVAGILTEGFSVGERAFVAVGIGINLYGSEEDFPEELRGKADSLRAKRGSHTPLVIALMRELTGLLRSLDPEEFMDEYRAASLVLGERVRFCENGEQAEGVVEQIDNGGALHLRLDDGTAHVLAGGEISLTVEV